MKTLREAAQALVASWAAGECDPSDSLENDLRAALAATPLHVAETALHKAAQAIVDSWDEGTYELDGRLGDDLRAAVAMTEPTRVMTDDELLNTLIEVARLTDENEKHLIITELELNADMRDFSLQVFRAIEAQVISRISPPKPEAVARVVIENKNFVSWNPELTGEDISRLDGKNLYTSPPAQRKPWVWLTDAEIRQCEQTPSRSYIDHARAIEAKLREKNK